MLKSKPPPRTAPPCRRRILIAAACAAVVIALALGLGLGLGLGLKRGKEEEEEQQEEEPGETEHNPAWTPEVGASWQIVLRSPLELSEDMELTPDVEVYDIDLFDNSQETISELRRRGKRVICYFSAGSFEPDRPDSSEFSEEDMGDELDGWPGEHWLQLSSTKVRSIMAGRIKTASDKGCHAIDPDNVDGFQNDNGLHLTPDDSISFVRFLSNEANKYNLATGLKNAGDIIADVLPHVDFSVNEQCAEYGECKTFAAFIDEDKPVFQIEYPDGANSTDGIDESIKDEHCHSEGSDGFSTVLKEMKLEGWVEYCDGEMYDTAVESTDD